MNTTDDRIRRLVIESLDVELGGRADPIPDRLLDLDVLPRSTRPRTARLAAPLLAAAAVIAAIAAAALADSALESGRAGQPAGGTGLPSANQSSSVNAPGGIQVTCSSVDGSSLDADTSALMARASRIDDQASMVAPSPGTSVVITVRGTTPKTAGSVCDSPTMQFRPVIAPPVMRAAGTSTDGLVAPGFSIPSSAAGYESLTATQRSRLDRAVARAGCGSMTADVRGPVVQCQGDHAVLLGPPVVTGAGIADARALPLGNSGTSGTSGTSGAQATGWTVRVSLRPSAAQVWNAYTSGNNTGGDSTATLAGCSTATRSCADWIAVVDHGRIISIPPTESATDSEPSIGGAFDEKTAQSLAAGLRADVLPVPVTLRRTVVIR